MPAGTRYDLAVVGSGPIAAVAVNRFLRQRFASTVAMFEAGSSLTERPGEHLTATQPDALRTTYQRLKRQVEELGDRDVDATPEAGGVMPAQYLGHDLTEFPGAIVASNVGGMGVYWTGACPRPYGPELPPSLSIRHLDVAQRLLRVRQDAYRAHPCQEPILATLARALPSDDPTRSVQPMPMAGRVDPLGRLHRTAPVDVLPQLAEPSTGGVTLFERTRCTRLVVRDGQVTGVVVRDAGGEEREIGARAVLVAADPLRTPQLLWASGIRPAALGRYLNEHAMLGANVEIDRARLGVADRPAPVPTPGEPFVGAYWYPSRGERQPIHGQFLEIAPGDGSHVLGLSFYVTTQIRADNGIEFSTTELDHAGMPRLTVRFRLGDSDLAAIERARRVLAATGAAIGDFDEQTVVRFPPGTSMHYTGTTRMGTVDDGTSVCDQTGRVWGYRNLFLAGNGVVPTALSCNATLTSAALAVQTGERAAETV